MSVSKRFNLKQPPQNKAFFQTLEYSSDYQPRKNKWMLDSESAQLSKKYLQDKDYENAAKVLSQMGDDLENKFLLGYTLINLNQNDKAIQALEELLRLDPLFKKELYVLLSKAYQNLNRLDQARFYLEQALKHFPDYFDATIHLAQLFAKLEQYNAAIQHYDKALALKSDNFKIQLLKADCLINLKDYPKALAIYEEIFKHHDKRCGEQSNSPPSTLLSSRAEICGNPD